MELCKIKKENIDDKVLNRSCRTKANSFERTENDYQSVGYIPRLTRV